MNAMTEKLRMTLTEACAWVEERYGVRLTEDTLCNWRRYGVGGKKLPYTRVGGRVYVRAEDVASFIEVHEQK